MDGTSYTGAFDSDCISGQGRLENAAGDLIYEGNWQDNQFQGFGKHIDELGNSYEGEFCDGLRQGKGVFQDGQGVEQQYDGQWVQDVRTGQGTQTYVTGDM